MRSLTVVLLALLLVLLMAGGCWNPFKPGGGGGGGDGKTILDRKTPENLFEFYSDAYETRDIDRYEECLHDSFRFWFLEQDHDTAGLPPGIYYWGKSEEVRVMNNMFNAEEVLRTVMHLNICSGPDTALGGKGLSYRLDPDVKLTRMEEREAGQEEMTYFVSSSYFDVIVVQDSFGLWQFWEMEEILKH